MKSLVLVLGLIFFQSSWATPHYIRLGYTTCTGCHQSSNGSGLLTDYGKGISASESMFAKDLDSFNPSASRYHQAFQMRVMNINRSSGSRTFPMQFDYLSSLTIKEKVRLQSILAVAPPSQNKSEQSELIDRVYFRELALEYIINNKANLEDRIKIGVGILPLGIGLIDHTSFVREANRLFVTDIPFHLTYYRNRVQYNVDSFVFLPHPNETKINAEKGVGSRLFFKLNPKFSIGSQFLVGESPSIERQMVGLLAKTGKDKVSYLGEINYTLRTLKLTQTQFSQWTLYQGLSFYPLSWLTPSITYQKLVLNEASKTIEDRYAILLDWKMYAALSFNTELRFISTDLQRESEIFLQAYLNWW